MNNQELRELENEIARTAFNMKVESGCWDYDGMPMPWTIWIDAEGNKHNPKRFTEDKSEAFEVLQKCGEVAGNIEIGFAADGSVIVRSGKSTSGFCETLPLAICLFAQQLFSPTSKERGGV